MKLLIQLSVLPLGQDSGRRRKQSPFPPPFPPPPGSVHLLVQEPHPSLRLLGSSTNCSGQNVLLLRFVEMSVPASGPAVQPLCGCLGRAVWSKSSAAYVVCVCGGGSCTLCIYHCLLTVSSFSTPATSQPRSRQALLCLLFNFCSHNAELKRLNLYLWI